MTDSPKDEEPVLPMAEAPSGGHRATASSRSPAVGSAASWAPILVVEDDVVSGAVIARHLAALGLVNPVQMARNGDDAVAWLAQRVDGASGRLPALILLDRHLPGRDGIEVLRWIRSVSALQSTPVLMLTAAVDVATISEAYTLGARSYLVKPIGLEALGEIVRGLDLRWAIVPAETTP